MRVVLGSWVSLSSLHLLPFLCLPGALFSFCSFVPNPQCFTSFYAGWFPCALDQMAPGHWMMGLKGIFTVSLLGGELFAKYEKQLIGCLLYYHCAEMIAFLCHLHVLGLQPREEGRRRKKVYTVWSEPSSPVVTECPWHTLALLFPGKAWGRACWACTTRLHWLTISN